MSTYECQLNIDWACVCTLLTWTASYEEQAAIEARVSVFQDERWKGDAEDMGTTVR